MTIAITTFSSRLAPILGKSLDRFLHEQAAKYPDLSAGAFQGWCQTQEHLASGVRRRRMLQVHNFCLYRRRTDPQCFVPDPAWFPKPHQSVRPYIFSEQEVARLLTAASGWKRVSWSPLRPEVMRLALVLLFTTGIRRAELPRLTLSDYDRGKATLLIRESKFHKSRLLPLNGDIAEEINHYLQARARRKLPLSPHTALIGNTPQGDGLTAATSCNTVCGSSSNNAPSSPRRADCRDFMTLVSMPTPRLCRLLTEDSSWERLGLCPESA